jgi:HSP20 family molecular chaperone IbpA
MRWVVSAELPDLGEKDVDVTLTEDVLLIRGEKKLDEEKKGARLHVHRAFLRLL